MTPRRPGKGTIMKGFVIAAALALAAAILAPNDARAGVSFQFGYGGGYYGHGHHGYGYPNYGYRRYGYRPYRYRRYGYQSFLYRNYGYPTYEYAEPVYAPPSAAAAPVQQAPAPAPREPQAYCREYTKEIIIDGETQTAYGTACMQADGSWRLVN